MVRCEEEFHGTLELVSSLQGGREVRSIGPVVPRPSLGFLLFEGTENEQILFTSPQVSSSLHELNKYLQCVTQKTLGKFYFE